MGSERRYPGYDVMHEAEAWDDHSREIVKKRLGPYTELGFLTREEAETLGSFAAVVVDDDLRETAAFIVHEIDRRLQSRIGEDQRQAGVPPEANLVRGGLAAIEATAHSDFGTSFKDLELIPRQTLLDRVERGECPSAGPWQNVPQKEFFKKLLTLAVETYYSHPSVWSEIGYGGPAYPRGYVRSELGLTDPWEARD